MGRPRESHCSTRPRARRDPVALVRLHARGQRRQHRPRPVPPAAIPGIRAPSAICGTSAMVPMPAASRLSRFTHVDRWPPASLPCATTASTPASATTRASSTGATMAMTLMPRSWHRRARPAPGSPRPMLQTRHRSHPGLDDRILDLEQPAQRGPEPLHRSTSVSRVASTPILAQTVAGGTRPGYGTSMAARLTLLLVGLLLAGCGSVFPKASLVGVNRALTLEELRRDPDAHRGERVVLGGEILATTPKVGQTEIEVLSRPLGGSDAPKRTDRSDGRFLAVTPDFLDPAIYSAGRRLTVLGTVVGGEERKLGELPYRYPLIRVEHMYLWAQDVLLGGYPYYGDPFLYGPPGFYVGGYWGRRFPGPPYPFWW